MAKSRDDEWAWAEKPDHQADKPVNNPDSDHQADRRQAITDLLELNVNRHTEKKGRFTYLSWPWAQQELLKRDPDAMWCVVDWPGGWPYIQTPAGAFVRVVVTFMGKTQEFTHPVLDDRNKAIQEPTAFDINTSIMRAFVKCAAVGFGLGLYIYSGDDLPAPHIDLEKATEIANRYREFLKADIEDDDRALGIWAIYLEHKDDEPLTGAIGDKMTKTQVRQMKEYIRVGGELAQQQPMKANGRA